MKEYVLTKKCLVCSRDFPAEDTQCYQCSLPLYDTADFPVMQEMDLNRILLLVMRRHDNLVMALKPKPVRRLERVSVSPIRRLIQAVIAL